MANVFVEETTLKSIADAIREKTGKTNLMLPADMVTEIAGISTGGSSGSDEWENVLIGIIDRSATDITLPAGIASIGSYAFQNYTNLVLISLPEGLKSIGSYAFQNCTNLALTELPAGITSIGSYAFQNCTNLTKLTFKGTPASISSSAFSNCINFLTINVPWAEGAVANAPWGATNATINYNYVPEEG